MFSRFFLVTTPVFLSLLLLTNVASAASVVGKLDGLQLPAWLDRGGLTVPASPGIDLYAGDRLRTGRGARLLITLNEGSFVRLGENATFEIAAAQRKSGVYTAALNVLEGAFRFTTKAVAKAQPRDVQIRIANNATIGIRGTDLWGRGRGDKDIVCLLEGKIDVTGNNNRTLRLDQPLQFFQSTRTAPPEPIGFVDPKQIVVWAKETDIEDGKGISAKGEWTLSVAGFATRDAMFATSRALRDAGYPVNKAANNTLAITRLTSEAEANALAATLKNDFSLNDTKASR